MSDALTVPVRTDAASRSTSSQMRGDQLFVDHTGDEWRQRRPIARRAEGIKPSLGQVRDSRRKRKPQQIRESEDVIADAAAVGVMCGNAEVRLVIEQSVDDMR